MRHIAIVCIILVVAGGAMARELTPLRTDLPLPVNPNDAAAACVAGNNATGSILGYYSSWFAGTESYAVPINAADAACGCAEGVAVTTIHMVMALDISANFQATVSILDAETDGAGCLSPGATVAISPVYTISGIGATGYYDIALPITAPCATVADAQFIAFNFKDDNGGALVGIPITAGPSSCFSYNNWGPGWEDLVSGYGFDGNIVMWADMDCCSAPVDVEDANFGSIKALFR